MLRAKNRVHNEEWTTVFRKQRLIIPYARDGTKGGVVGHKGSCSLRQLWRDDCLPGTTAGGPQSALHSSSRYKGRSLKHGAD